MQKIDRKSYVLRLLSEKPSVSVVELRDAFGLSEVSVRKLLDTMEKEGTIKRTWGGAVSAMSAMGEPTYEEKAIQNLVEKQAIARTAYNLIADGDAVYLDSGTTTLQLARLLASGHKRNILVCTNAVNLAMEFRMVEDMDLVVIGGAFHPKILSCSGGLAKDMLRTLFFDKGFLSGSHFSTVRGLTTPNMQEAEIKRTVLSCAKEIYMLTDFSKYGGDSLSQIAPIGEINTLITDWRATEDVVASFEALGVRVMIASRD